MWGSGFIHGTLETYFLHRHFVNRKCHTSFVNMSSDCQIPPAQSPIKQHLATPMFQKNVKRFCKLLLKRLVGASRKKHDRNSWRWATGWETYSQCQWVMDWNHFMREIGLQMSQDWLRIVHFVVCISDFERDLIDSIHGEANRATFISYIT